MSSGDAPAETSLEESALAFVPYTLSRNSLATMLLRSALSGSAERIAFSCASRRSIASSNSVICDCRAVWKLIARV